MLRILGFFCNVELAIKGIRFVVIKPLVQSTHCVTSTLNVHTGQAELNVSYPQCHRHGYVMMCIRAKA